MQHIDNYGLNLAPHLAQEATSMASPSRCCRMQALTVATASLAALHCSAIYSSTKASHSLPPLTASSVFSASQLAQLAGKAQIFNFSYSGTTLQPMESLLYLLPYFPFINRCFFYGFTGNNPPCYCHLVSSSCKDPTNSLPSSKFLLCLLQQ